MNVDVSRVGVYAWVWSRESRRSRNRRLSRHDTGGRKRKGVVLNEMTTIREININKSNFLFQAVKRRGEMMRATRDLGDGIGASG